MTTAVRGPHAPRLRGSHPRSSVVVWPRIVFLTAHAVLALHLVADIAERSSRRGRQLLTINPVWFVVMLAAEFASFACAWALQRLALRTAEVVRRSPRRSSPGTRSAASCRAGRRPAPPIQYRMLVASGLEPTHDRNGAHGRVAHQLGDAVRAPGPGAAGDHLRSAGAARPGAVGLAGGRVVRVGVGRRRGAPLVAPAARRNRSRDPVVRRTGCTATGRNAATCPTRSCTKRDEIRVTLGARWWLALLFAMGNWLFDYLALLGGAHRGRQPPAAVARVARVRRRRGPRDDPHHAGRAGVRRGRPHRHARAGRREPGGRRARDARLPVGLVLDAAAARAVRVRDAPPPVRRTHGEPGP